MDVEREVYLLQKKAEEIKTKIDKFMSHQEKFNTYILELIATIKKVLGEDSISN